MKAKLATTSEDFWDQDDFEDNVASVLIACFETSVKKDKNAVPRDRMTSDRLALLRREGPYIASNSRIYVAPASYGMNWGFDIENDPLPHRGCRAINPRFEGKLASSIPNAYMFFVYLNRTDRMERYWHRRGGGTIYEMLLMFAENDGIDGERRYITVSKTGEVVACTPKIPNVRGYKPGVPIKTLEMDEEWLHTTSVWAAFSLQAFADRRFCWTITAQEKEAKAHLGCMQEEIKSLLYARSLPMTATGRKRPILHLVEAHKRRMKNGTDVDITAFLRGQQTVEIGGTMFKVRAPTVLRPTLSRPSQDRYYDKVVIED
jgi:hypothetical protein